MKKKVVSIILLVAGMCLAAQALDTSFTGAGANWTNSALWTAGIPAAGDIAYVTNNLTANRIATISSVVTNGAVYIGTMNGAFARTIGGASGTMVFDNGGNGSHLTMIAPSTNSTVNVANITLNDNLAITNLSSTAPLSIASAISGNKAISVAGGYGVALSGVNTYSGGTILNSGKLNINSTTALGTGTFTINGGKIGTTGGANVTIANANPITLGGDFEFVASGNGLNLGTGDVDLGTGNRTITASGTANALTIGGTITNSGSLTKAGAQTLTLTGANTYSGGTTISEGTLSVGAGANTGNGLGTGGVTNNAALVFNHTNNLTVANNISGTGSLTKSAAGTLTLSGNNTYSGDTVLNNAAKISVSSDANLGSGTNITINQNATLYTTASFATSKQITLAAAAGSQDISVDTGTTLTLNGKVTGSAAVPLRIAGGGTVVYAAANDHTTGTTVINGSKLKISGAGILGATSSALTLNSSSADLGGTAQTIGALKFIGVSSQLSNGNITVTSIDVQNTAGNARIEANLHGIGAAFTKTNNGIATLTGTNDYTGATTVSLGTLLINGDNSGATGLVTVAAAAILGGNGTVGADIQFADGAKFQFDPASTLTALGNVTFANFGVVDVIGVDSNTVLGTYTLISGTVDFANIANTNLASAFDLGGGKSAYFQQGSLDLVVVPEPATIGMLGLGALITIMIRRMRTR